MTALAYAHLFDDDETEEKTEFTFAELDDRAKERAREWFRQNYPDNDWWDCVYDDADKVAAMLGASIDTKAVRLMGGGTRHDPAIYFSGFWSQGDGACFDGDWQPVDDPTRILDEVLAHAPQDERLHEIALDLAVLSERCNALIPGAWARVRHSGHYSHSGCTAIEFDLPTPDHVLDENDLQMMVWNALVTAARLDYDSFNEAITSALRSLMDWIYRQLQAEYDYLTSDEAIDGLIGANDYLFDEGGRII